MDHAVPELARADAVLLPVVQAHAALDNNGVHKPLVFVEADGLLCVLVME